MKIIPIGIEHSEGFYECLDAVAKEKKFLAQTESQPLEKVKGFVKKSVEDDAIQFVAVVNNKVVGWADIFPHWASTLSHRGSLGMGVDYNYRRQGIGEKLLTACLDKAKKKGITRIELETREDNLPSINLYKKLGFSLECVKKNAMKFNGEYFDSLQMSIIL